MENTTNMKHHTHISSKHRWMELNLQEVWRYRDLVYLFTKRSFVLLYKQTILGPAWVFLNPLISSFVYAFVFGGIAGIDTEGIPPMLFYLCSNAIWIYFSSCVVNNANAFTANANVFCNVYFPRLTVPISNVFSSVIQFGVQMLLVLACLIYYLIQGDVMPNWGAWLMIPVMLVHLGVLGLGCGIIISSLTTKYRDLAILVSFAVSLWMYITPIVYPMSQLGDGILKKILLLNPVTAPVEMLRYALLGQGSVMPGYLAMSAVVSIGVMIFGIMIFNKVEKTFMDTV